jgi:hypothetical protein
MGRDDREVNDESRPTVRIRRDEEVAPVPLAVEAVRLKIRTRYQTLPNATSGMFFAAQVELGESGAPIEIVGTRGIEAANLVLDADNRLLSGVLPAEGEYRLEIEAISRDTGGEAVHTRWVGTLTVNPDPRSLWRDLPSEVEDPFWKPDVASERQVNGERLLLAASKRGRSHAHSGGFRDDDVRIAVDAPAGWQILVVADGAGTACASRLGSRIACEAVLAELPGLIAQHLEPNVERLAARLAERTGGNEVANALYQSLVRAAFLASKAVARAAEEAELSARDLSTTLLLVVHRQTAAGHFFAGFGIGDGLAAVLDLATMTVFSLNAADSGAYAGQTRFLSDSEFSSSTRLMERLRFTVLPHFTAAFAMTDGVSDAKFIAESDQEDGGVWRDLWNEDLSRSVNFGRMNHHAQYELLDWLDFWVAGNHDDRTIAVLI